MDIRFLKSISEAYVMDSDLETNPDQIFEELWDVVKFLQSYDNKLYNEMYEGTKLQQQRIFKNYLDISYEQQLLNEDVIVPSGLVLVSIVSYIFGKSIAKGIAKTLAILGEGFETLGRWLARHGKYSQIRYAIVQENTRKCYAKCGIQKPSDIHVGTYATVNSSS